MRRRWRWRWRMLGSSDARSHFRLFGSRDAAAEEQSEANWLCCVANASSSRPSRRGALQSVSTSERAKNKEDGKRIMEKEQPLDGKKVLCTQCGMSSQFRPAQQPSRRITAKLRGNSTHRSACVLYAAVLHASQNRAEVTVTVTALCYAHIRARAHLPDKRSAVLRQNEAQDRTSTYTRMLLLVKASRNAHILSGEKSRLLKQYTLCNSLQRHACASRGKLK